MTCQSRHKDWKILYRSNKINDNPVCDERVEDERHRGGDGNFLWKGLGVCSISFVGWWRGKGCSAWNLSVAPPPPPGPIISERW